MAKQKWYVVWEGVVPAIYTSWTECERMVKGYSGARYKSYDSEQEALSAFNGEQGVKENGKPSGDVNMYETNSISVDAACSGNPGVLEFRGVDTATGEEIFAFGPFMGTNNIGEFLGLVHALQHYPGRTIYTDSVTAMAWVRDKKLGTNLPRNVLTESLWQLIDSKLDWLHTHTYQNRILKWDTKAFGDIKADYGRK